MKDMVQIGKFSDTFIHQHTFTGMAFPLKETWPLRIRCIVPCDIGVSKNSCKSSSLKCTWHRTSFSLNLPERAFSHSRFKPSCINN